MSQEHVQLNIDKPTGPDAPVVVKPAERPAWLPENFKAPEDLAKSYTDQRAEITRLQQELAGKKAPEGEKKVVEGEKKPDEKKAEEANDLAIKEKIEEAGLNYDKYSDELVKTGKLSDESYKELEGKFPRELIDDYLALKQESGKRIGAELKEAAGGDEQFKAMITWAASWDGKNAYNKMINSGDVEQMKLAVNALSAAYAKGNGVRPNLLNGSGGAPMSDVYQDQAQWLKDIQSTEYQTSPAFRKQVEEKTGRSTAIFAPR